MSQKAASSFSGEQPQVFAPYRCVASFADGSRLTFDGLTREQARFSMEAAMKQHGDLSGWSWVTDENYIKGEYYKLIPPPPLFPFPILDLSDCETEEERRKALQAPFEPDSEPYDPDDDPYRPTGEPDEPDDDSDEL